MSARRRAASAWPRSNRKAASDIGSPPLSPLGPSAGGQVDFEAARPLILPLRVAHDIFAALDPAARQPAPQDVVEPRQRGTVDSREIDSVLFHDDVQPFTSKPQARGRDRWSSGG